MIHPEGADADWHGDYRDRHGDARLVAPVLGATGKRDAAFPRGRAGRAGGLLRPLQTRAGPSRLASTLPAAASRAALDAAPQFGTGGAAITLRSSPPGYW